MKPLWAIILIISILGNGIGLYFAYRFLKHDRLVGRLQTKLAQDEDIINNMNRSMPTQLLFLHHSVGKAWLEEGGLREALMAKNIGVHDATYGDEVGEMTDIVHWVPKFKNDMQRVLTFDRSPNTYYKDGRQNDIIMFKSCYPNSDIAAEGQEPENASDNAKTTWNYRAVFAELQGIMAKYPNKVFIYVTAPPLVPNQTKPENAKRAREFNNWVKSQYVTDYTQKTGQLNLMVFDFFDVLADKDNYLKAEYRRSDQDSHPNPAGGQAATVAFIDFLKSKGVISAN
jgi:hypothetical protein